MTKFKFKIRDVVRGKYINNLIGIILGISKDSIFRYNIWWFSHHKKFTLSVCSKNAIVNYEE